MFLFFLLIRRATKSTLFPYTTLFRSWAIFPKRLPGLVRLTWYVIDLDEYRASLKDLGRAYRERSEEHTSELQSRQYLVCRLLLEKKKNNILRHPNFAKRLACRAQCSA